MLTLICNLAGHIKHDLSVKVIQPFNLITAITTIWYVHQCRLGLLTIYSNFKLTFSYFLLCIDRGSWLRQGQRNMGTIFLSSPVSVWYGFSFVLGQQSSLELSFWSTITLQGIGHTFMKRNSVKNVFASFINRGLFLKVCFIGNSV